MLLDGENMKDVAPQELNEKELQDFLVYARHYARNDSADRQILTNRIKAALNRATTLGYNNGIVEAYQVLALIHMSANDNEMAASALETSQALIHKYHLPEDAMLELYNTYVIFYLDYMGDGESAAKTCQKGMNLARQLNRNDMVMKFTANLGALYVTSGAFDEAAPMLEASLSYYISLEDPIRSLYCHSNLGEAYMGQGLYDLALVEYGKALDMAITYEESSIIEEATLGLAKIHVLKDQSEKAMELLEITLRHLQNNSNLPLGDKLIFEVVQLYLNKGDILMADVWMKEYEDVYGELGHRVKDLTYYELRAAIALGSGDYRTAYDYKSMHHEMYLAASTEKARETLSKIKASELTRAVDRLKTISEIGCKLTRHLSHEHILYEIHEAMKGLMSIDSIGLGLIENDRITYATYRVDMDEEIEFQVPLTIEGTLAGWCIHHKKELMINDIAGESDLYVGKVNRIMNRYEGKLTQSIIYIPLMLDDTVIGLFTVQSYSLLAYSSEDLETIKAISAYLAVRLQNSKQAKALEDMSYVDVLTGVTSRSGLIHYTDSEDSYLSQDTHMIMIDLDHFKQINDRFGHAVGDQVLKTCGSTLNQLAQDNQGIASRLGGEEFCMIIPGASIETIEALGQRLLQAFRAIEIREDSDYEVTASIGVYHYEGQERPDLDLLYKYADRALYTAKHLGRNQVVTYGDTEGSTH